MGIGSALALGVERIIAPVEDIHAVIARRWLGRLGPVGRRLIRPYEGTTRFVYGSIRVGTAAVGAGLDRVLSVEAATLDGLRSWTNGFFGDGLGRHERRLGTSMTVPVVPVAEATGRLVVLVHGLGRTEGCWEGNSSGPGLAQALADDPGLTPVPIRYNTGRSVADNGILLADLMEDLIAGWPVPIESIALVGHSMGGLVIAEAIGAGLRAGLRWVHHVTDMVSIGTPHQGAPLEKIVRATARGLAAFSTTRPLAEFLDGRSAGIKDLGFTRDDDALPSGVRYHLVAGVATIDPGHPVGRMVGDLMVRIPSSTRPGGAEPTSALVVGGVTHFDLLHAPAVLDQVMEWLDPRG
jgi:pimeloyl-ACP methyl ester carboxylesterase